MKREIVRNGIGDRMRNGKMPNVAGKKDGTPEIRLSLSWDRTRSQKLGAYMEHESRAWNPALHSYFFSMETVLVLLQNSWGNSSVNFSSRASALEREA